MTAIVFVGPTLHAQEIAEAGDFVSLPPVAQGDVYRAALSRPRAIGIIDGYFSGVPAVWHKEILWAMSRGRPRLRQRQHGRAAGGGIARLRNARRRAHFRGVPRRRPRRRRRSGGRAWAGRDRLSSSVGGDGQHPRDAGARRSERRAQAAGRGAPWRHRQSPCSTPIAIGRRCSWARPRTAFRSPRLRRSAIGCRKARVDQKRLDALEMLAAMREAPAAGEPRACEFHFEWTHLWDAFVAGPATASPRPRAGSIDPRRTEARRAGRICARGERRRCCECWRRAARRVRQRFRATRRERRWRGFASQFGLYARADLDRWMAANDLDSAALEALIE